MLIYFPFKEGFLADQREPGTAGNRLLRYDIADGMFLLATENYAKIHCDMSFGLYPFDTQTCLFRMRTAKSNSQQVDIAEDGPTTKHHKI